MIKYQVHFEYPDKKSRRLKRGIRHVNARSESEAKAKIRNDVPLSFGHWVNIQANEAIK